MPYRIGFFPTILTRRDRATLSRSRERRAVHDGAVNFFDGGFDLELEVHIDFAGMFDVLGAETGGEPAEFAGNLQGAGDVGEGEFFGGFLQEDIEGVLGGTEKFLGGFPFGILKEAGALGAERSDAWSRCA